MLVLLRKLLNSVSDHKSKKDPLSFTAKYNCNKLVYYFYYSHIEEAIDREKYLKGKLRQYKIELINAFNPEWHDLFDMLVEEWS